jgi:hypothetical protein
MTITEEILESNRAKTSLRMHYDAQAAVIERQLGGLEGVRSKLGLSQRKMAQLLMVDPSAWTRWNRPGNRAPSMVWRALQWYMILQEKIPGLTPNYFLGPSQDVLKFEVSRKFAEFETKIQGFRSTNDDLLLKVFDLEKKVRMWRVGTMIMTVTLIFVGLIWVLWARRAY